MKNKIQLCLALLISSTSLFSQDEIIKKLDEVIVSANRAKTNNNITNVQIITLEDIKNAPVQTIEDLLEYAINVDVRQRGVQGVQADISMRGGTFEQVLVMLNGVKLNDPQTGHHTMNLPVSLEQIKRIEIITGGCSRIFGNYAYTGAINIITKTEMNNSFISSVGNNNFKHGEINYHLAVKKTKHNISIVAKESDGYIEGMDYKIMNYYYQAEKKIDNIRALLNIGHIDKEFGAFSFYTPVYPDQFEKTNTTFLSMQLKKEGRISLENKMYWRRNKDEYILFRENPEWYHNFHKTNVFGMDINITQKTKTGTNALGMEIRNNNIISNVLGEELDEPIEIDTINFYYKGASQTTTNLFAEKNINYKRLFLSTGIMMNINSRYGNEFFPGLDISYNVSKNISIFASHSRSMRTPNYTELYYLSPTNEGNQNLRPEHSINMEVGLKLKSKTHNTSFTYYQRTGSDMIDWVLLNEDSIWRTQNLSKVTTTGYEINSVINLNNILFIPFSTLKINYSFNESDTISEGFQSAYVLDHLRSKLSITASQKINNIRLDWRTSFQDREGEYKDFETGNQIEYLPFWLVSLRASYTILSKHNIFIEINNLFNQEYVDFGNVPQPGRWIRIGTKINL